LNPWILDLMASTLTVTPPRRLVVNLLCIATWFYLRGMELLNKEDSKVIRKATGNYVKNSVK
jgi:hypothetical protein